MTSSSPAPRKRKSSRITVHDVAAHAGVAISTVSRVINGAPRVAEDIQQRVQAAIDELGWTPSVAAQAMRGAATRMVGFIFSDVRNPMYASAIKGAEDILSDCGYMLMIASSGGSSEREMALLELFQRRRADGLIFGIEDETHAGVLQKISGASFPTVLLERETALPLHSVGADHYTGVRHATQHLISLGHRRIALISGGRHNRVGRDRLAGLRDAHIEAGIPLDPALLRLDSFSKDYAYREAQLLLTQKNRPTAIISAGMHHLEGVLPAIRTVGLSIPHDLSLISSNDTPLASLSTPALSVIRYDADGLGAEAALLLLKRMEGTLPAERVRFQTPTEFILRDSCAPPPQL
jgi:LacI family transcriptional regulator